MKKEKLTMLQCCPTCNCSWRGSSFLWIYKHADQQAVEARIKEMKEANEKSDNPLPEKELKRKFPKPIREQYLAAHVQKVHGDRHNQSRLLLTEDNKYLVCPDCHTAYPLDWFKEKELFIKQQQDNA
jgi:uncharacterized protein YbaR (Trm112 family)